MGELRCLPSLLAEGRLVAAELPPPAPEVALRLLWLWLWLPALLPPFFSLSRVRCTTPGSAAYTLHATHAHTADTADHSAERSAPAEVADGVGPVAV